MRNRDLRLHERARGAPAHLLSLSDNFAILLVGDEDVEVLPAEREVRAGAEELRLGIEWRDDGAAWTEVIVDRFVRVADGSAVAIEAPARFVRGERTTGEVRFRAIEKTTDFCEYEVTLKGPERTPLVRTFHLLLLGAGDIAPADEGRRA